jgi:hypothetical protein
MNSVTLRRLRSVTQPSQTITFVYPQSAALLRRTGQVGTKRLSRREQRHSGRADEKTGDAKGGAVFFTERQAVTRCEQARRDSVNQ